MALLNFRDVYSSGQGPLLPGRLFRAAQPYYLDDADLAVVRESGISTIVDLRELHEQVAPDWAPVEATGVRVVRVPVADQILPSADEDAPPPAAGIQSGSVPQGHQILTDFYLAIIDRAGIRLAEMMAAVADGGPVLLHCAAGKDRTGTTVALLLDLIGTDHEVIVADYLLTNEAVPEVMDQLIGQVSPERRRDPATIPPGIRDAPESAIRATLAHITALGGAAAVLVRTTDPAIIARAIAALTT